jgi:hypothetical protein
MIDTSLVLKISLVMAVLALVITACKRKNESHVMPGEKRVDAREWFEKHSPSAFAGNRFKTPEEGRKFAELLYEKGAKQVYVAGIEDDPMWVKKQGGPTADSLIVVLPKDKTMRRAIFALQGEEAVKQGFDPSEDTGETELLFWWD